MVATEFPFKLGLSGVKGKSYEVKQAVLISFHGVTTSEVSGLKQ